MCKCWFLLSSDFFCKTLGLINFTLFLNYFWPGMHLYSQEHINNQMSGQWTLREVVSTEMLLIKSGLRWLVHESYWSNMWIPIQKTNLCLANPLCAFPPLSGKYFILLLLKHGGTEAHPPKYLTGTNNTLGCHEIYKAGPQLCVCNPYANSSVCAAFWVSWCQHEF